MGKCKNCGYEEPKLFETNAEGKKVFRPENWRSLFKIDWMVLFLVLIIIVSAFMYQRDTATARDMIAHPEKYCSYYVGFPSDSDDVVIGENVSWNLTNYTE